MDSYKTTVGIEVHAELKTKSKIFSNSANNYGKMANTCTNVIDLGYPGVLPTLNEEVLKLALRAALVLNCKINKKMVDVLSSTILIYSPKGKSKTPPPC